eukprot:689376-Prymnesium_polylepis.1
MVDALGGLQASLGALVASAEAQGVAVERRVDEGREGTAQVRARARARARARVWARARARSRR